MKTSLFIGVLLFSVLTCVHCTEGVLNSRLHQHLEHTTPQKLHTKRHEQNSSQHKHHIEDTDLIRQIIDQRLDEPLLKNVQGMPIHFGVVIPTFPRSNDQNYLLLRYTAMRFLMNQTFHNWTAVIAGDGLTTAMTSNLLASLKDIPREKYIFVNLPLNETERDMYRRGKRGYYRCKTVPRGRDFWCHSGTSAFNLGVRTAAALKHVTHIARLDDDDFFFRNHLANAAAVYQQYPEAHFTFSEGYFVGSRFPSRVSLRYNLTHSAPLRGIPSQSVSMLWTWRLSNDAEIASIFYFQHDFSQVKRSPRMNSYDNSSYCYANDGDLQSRINSFIVSHNLTQFSIFIPYPDGLAFPKTERHTCIKRMNDDYDQGVVTDVVTSCELLPLSMHLGYAQTR